MSIKGGIKMFRRYQKCYCMNNNCQNEDTNSDILETKCNQVKSYEDDFDSCGCGFDEEKVYFQKILCLHKVMYQFNIWIKHLNLVLD